MFVSVLGGDGAREVGSEIRDGDGGDIQWIILNLASALENKRDLKIPYNLNLTLLITFIYIYIYYCIIIFYERTGKGVISGL